MRKELKTLKPALGITFSEETLSLSCQIEEMEEGGPATEAGLLLGDELLAIGSCDTPNRLIFTREVAKHRVGDVVKIKVRQSHVP